MSGLNETFVRHGEDRRLAELVAMLRRNRPNVLVVGPTTDINRTVELMHPYLRTPIVSWMPRDTRKLPAGSFRTLMIRDVQALDSTQQEELVAWICRLSGDIQ